MKNKLYKIYIIIFFIIGCAGTKAKYLKPDEFIQKAETMIGSASWKTYIGKSHNRIYFEYGDIVTISNILGLSNKPAYIIYWTELDKIPKSFIDKLENERIKYDQRMDDWQKKQKK